MRFSKVLLGLAITVVVSVQLAQSAQAREGWFGSGRTGSTAIYYGEVPRAGERANEETIQLALTCARNSTGIEISVSETSKALKPDKRVTVKLSAGGVSASATGKTLANELAGIPSLSVTFPATSSVFVAMKANRTLGISVGRWRSRTSPRGIGNRMTRLLADCQRKGTPRFSAYPAGPSYRGRPKSLKISSNKGAQSLPRFRQDILREEAKKSANFAAAFRLVEIGCGTACQAIFVISLRTGRIYSAPEAASAGVTFRRSSRLIRFNADPIYKTKTSFYIFTARGRFKKLRK